MHCGLKQQRVIAQVLQDALSTHADIANGGCTALNLRTTELNIVVHIASQYDDFEELASTTNLSPVDLESR
eukprot:6439974-Prymnesium_polylepis.1